MPIHENNFVYLFVGLITLLLVGPAASAVLERHPFFAQAAFTLLLLLGVWSLHESRAFFRAGLALAVASIVTAAVVTVAPSQPSWLLSLGIVWLFCLLSAVVGMRQVLAGGPVTLNHLLGAMSVYLLLGVLWGLLYAAVHSLAPEWFRLPGAVHPHRVEVFFYFSFVTLTTLGYGDITPAHPLVRAIASLEAVTGQLYLAVLVASLVGRRYAPDRTEQALDR